jgi:hypothetical protein
MTVLTGLLLVGAIVIAATLAVLRTIAAAAEILPQRARQGDGVRAHPAPATHPPQNRIPTRMGMKSQ